MSLVTIPSPSLSPVSGGPKDKFEGHLAVAVLRYPGNISRGPSSHSTACSCCCCSCCCCSWGLQWCGWGGDSTSGDGVRCWCQCWLSEEARSGARTVYSTQYSTVLYSTLHHPTSHCTQQSSLHPVTWRMEVTNNKHQTSFLCQLIYNYYLPHIYNI